MEKLYKRDKKMETNVLIHFVKLSSRWQFHLKFSLIPIFYTLYFYVLILVNMIQRTAVLAAWLVLILPLLQISILFNNVCPLLANTNPGCIFVFRISFLLLAYMTILVSLYESAIIKYGTYSDLYS